jgi:hypothetical protein
MRLHRSLGTQGEYLSDTAVPVLWQVLGGTCGGWLGWITLFISMFNLFGNGCAQIVAGAANSYSINPVMDKRCCARLPCPTTQTLSPSAFRHKCSLPWGRPMLGTSPGRVPRHARGIGVCRSCPPKALPWEHRKGMDWALVSAAPALLRR